MGRTQCRASQASAALPPPGRDKQRVFALHGRHRLDGMGAADCVNARLRKAKIFNFAFRDQLLDRACNLLNRYGGINAMLIEDVDDLSLEAFKRGFCYFPDVFRLAVEGLHGARPSSNRCRNRTWWR